MAICLAMVCAAQDAGVPDPGQEPHPDLELLGPKYNLVSNCSFEAVGRNGRPLAWDLYAQPQHFSIVTNAIHGKHALAADSHGDKHTAARQYISIRPGQKLTLEVWLRVEETDGRPICIYIDFRDEARERIKIYQAKWAGQPGQWTKLSLTAPAPEGAKYAAILVPYLYGKARVLVDCVWLGRADRIPIERERPFIKNLREVFARPTWVKVAWESNADSHTVIWRQPGIEKKWSRAEVVREREYSIVELAPDHEYEVRVLADPQKLYDLDGKLVEVTHAAESRPIVVRTRPWEARQWAGFKLWPTVHLNTFPDGTVYPCIEVYDDRFYILEARNYALYLSRASRM